MAPETQTANQPTPALLFDTINAHQRTEAIKAAQEKAKLLAGQIGQSIGPAYSITESGVVPYSPANVSQNRMDNFVGGAAEPENAIAPGTISVSAQVTVSFRLY